MKKKLVLLIPLLMPSVASWAQSPAAAGLMPGSASNVAATQEPLTGIQAADDVNRQKGFDLDVRYSQLAETGEVAGSGVSTTGAISGDLHMLFGKSTHPLSLTYSGGTTWSTQSTPERGTFQQFEIQQAVNFRKFTLQFVDTLSYLPNAPAAGGAIPGIGNITGTLGFGNLNPGLIPTTSIYTQRSSAVSNAFAMEADRHLTGRTDLTLDGSYGLQRFIDGDGIDSSQATGSIGMNYEISARSTIAAQYSYTRIFYFHSDNELSSQAALLSFSRRWTRRLNSHVSVGPQWVQSTFPLPTPLSYSANAGVTYDFDKVGLQAMYSRGISAGSGVVMGTRVDSLAVGISRRIDRNWSVAINATEARNASLEQQGTFDSTSGGVQVNRTLGRHASLYFSYTAIAQSNSGVQSPIGLFDGISNTFGAGISFSKHDIQLTR